MRKLASIVQIATCDPIPDTDRLSVATMCGKGWKVVTSRDEYKTGDLAIYFEIDSALPPDDERYAFLKDRCLRKFVSKAGNVLKEVIRIKTAKLRGVISQGLLIPLSKFPEIPTSTNIGDDVSDLLHVEHYDDIKAALAPMTGGNPIAADAMGKFPSDYIPKTDEERIQNLSEYFIDKKFRKFEVTEKNDGSSVTMFYSPTVDQENPFGVCSRNLRLKPITEKGAVPVPWQMAKKYDVENKMKNLTQTTKFNPEYAFQGELVGPGINKNRDMYTDYEWHVFKIFNITDQMYELPATARRICEELGLTYVPVIEAECEVFDRFTDTDALLKFAEGKTAHGNEREGLVFKSCDYPYVTFKAVSNRYLMKEND